MPFMTKPSRRLLDAVARDYRRRYGLAAWPVGANGAPWPGSVRPGALLARPSLQRAHAYALQEALHWGEPFVYHPLPGLVGWVVALVDGDAVRGGLLGGAVRTPGEPADTVAKALRAEGLPARAARRLADAVPVWPAARIREAALFLSAAFYRLSGWTPRLLDANRLKAAQQRQIAETIAQQKQRGLAAYPIDKERLLLTLIRAGDPNGARRVLNEMLGAMFLFSPKLPVLRARAIEMMGYLTRAAVEDSPLLEPLIERNHGWMQRLIAAPDFETLAHVLMQALDDFMDGIYARGFNLYNPTVGRILDYLAQRYSQPVRLREVAAHAGLSAFRVSHLLKQATGKTLLQHVMQLRIQKARQLLERSSLSGSDIAYQLGFCDQSYFIKHFRRLTGATPRRYRRSLTAPRSGAA